MSPLLLLLLSSTVFLLSNADPEIYFKEDFNDDNAPNRWVMSTFKGDDQGEFKFEMPKDIYDSAEDKGLKTTQDAKFYGISAKFSKAFSNKGKKLCIQLTVKHEQNIDCGGGYVKLLDSNFDGPSFHGDTHYHIMFGPDICGFSKKIVHVILNYKGTNYLIKKEIACKDETHTHLYTLIINPDNTYEVLIDNEKEASGSLEEDWDMLPPKMIDDVTATKPADFDKPKTIPDPSAKKPDDWDDEMDGEWTAPMIDNPDYVDTWVPPQVANPDFKTDPNLYIFEDIGGIGFDLWQVKSGTIFDNLIVTDDPEYCKSEGERVWKKRFAFEEERKKEEALHEAQSIGGSKDNEDGETVADDITDSTEPLDIGETKESIVSEEKKESSETPREEL